ncbi:expressed unknown protein [Seminavis robusta]|uniref:Uncharacterized protein n=1 Tax=Seminavis robusta TaxID=568900 RepID=A0A9N8HPB8_9STRA|nr:expressed unknown protein [Seminavis robusta]|eukprot:Sro1071_g237980.1 n/a (386) ;mRNA; r:28495-29652
MSSVTTADLEAQYVMQIPVAWGPKTLTEIHVRVRPEWSHVIRRLSSSGRHGATIERGMTEPEPTKCRSLVQHAGGRKSEGTLVSFHGDCSIREEEKRPIQPSKTQQELESCIQLLEQEGPGYLKDDSEHSSYTDLLLLQEESDDDSSASGACEFDFSHLDMTPFLQLSTSKVANNYAEHTVASDSEHLLLGRADFRPTSPLKNPEFLMSAFFPMECNGLDLQLELAMKPKVYSRQFSDTHQEKTGRSIMDDTASTAHNDSDEHDDPSGTSVCQQGRWLDDTDGMQPNRFKTVFHEFWHYYCCAIRQLRSRHVYGNVIDSRRRIGPAIADQSSSAHQEQMDYCYFEEDESLTCFLNIYREFWHYYPGAIEEMTNSIHGGSARGGSR